MPHLGLPSDRVVIVDYDTCWPALYQKEADRILGACDGRIAAMEHVGSTAVPGLAAKPILDIMIGVADFSEAETLIPELEGLGYTCLGTYGIEGRLFFRSPEPCTHHLHIVLMAGQFWREELLFRDYLRSHPGAGKAYVELKRGLAARYAHDRPSYTAAKTEFIEVALETARTGGQPLE